MRLNELDYDLPEELIAQEPIGNRADARMLVLNRRTGEIEHSRFYKLARHLRDGTLRAQRHPGLPGAPDDAQGIWRLG